MITFKKIKHLAKEGFVIRAAVFLLLVYILIPLLFRVINWYYTPIFETKLFFMQYTLLIIALFIAFNKKTLLEFKYKQDFIGTLLFSALTILSFYAFFLFKYKIQIINLYEVHLSILAYFLGALFLALALFGTHFFMRFIKQLIASFLITIMFFIFTFFLTSHWVFLSQFIAKNAYYFLQLSHSNAGMFYTELAPSLRLNAFSVVIGKACSGIESISLLISLAILWLVYDFKKINIYRFALLFPFAFVGMIAINILRIYLLMALGNHYPNLALSLFHTNAGWVLFVTYILLFSYYAYPYITNHILHYRKI